MQFRSVLNICLATTLLVLAACAPAAAPAPTSAPVAKPTGSDLDWDKLVASAKQERSVVLAGPTSQAYRDEVTKAFEARFGFPLEYVALPGSEIGARITREAEAKKVTIDVMLGGGGELVSLLPSGLLDPLKPALAMPEVVDPSKWKGGSVKWMDAQQQFLLQTMESAPSDLVVNPDQVKQGAITSWKDLLKPEFKGKVVSHDPRREGSGLSIATYLYHVFGADYVRALYQDQAVILSSDERQLADWVGRGTYPVGLGLVQRQMEPLRSLGLKFERVFPQDGPGYRSGGSSVLKLIKNRPHPTAGIVLANWVASKEGQEIYSRHVLDVSRRTDTNVPEVPSYLQPQANMTLDTYANDFYTKTRQEIREQLAKTLGS
jgi:iron(III) transport system substrate-binding protein